jgi:hypothetical protein
MRSLMLQRLCSSYASGLATAEKLLSGRVLDDEEMELELGDENLDFVDEEVRQLQAIIDVLSPHPTPAECRPLLSLGAARSLAAEGLHHLQPVF